MSSNLKIERNDESSITRMAMKGIIDEEAKFDGIFANLKPALQINLEAIDLINSCGVREWIHAIQAIPKSTTIVYEKVAPRMIEQANYVANFLGSGTVESFFAPYYCPKCKAEVNVLLSTEKMMKSLPAKAPGEKCPTCKTGMEFDDSEEEYFSFLEN